MSFEDILWRAKDGDEWAREEIFKMYRPLLARQATMEGVFYEDLFQELSQTLVKCIINYRPVK